MNWTSISKIAVVAVFLAVSSGCAHVISSDLRQQARRDLPFSAVLKDPKAAKGETVVWGGRVIETVNEKDHTRITVLQAPLDSLGTPGSDLQSEGRFIAKVPGFVDQEVYKKGRRITLAGQVVGKEVMPVGEVEYTYPVLDVKEIHLWRQTAHYQSPYVYDHWYWHGYPHPYYLPRLGFGFGYHGRL